MLMTGATSKKLLVSYLATAHSAFTGLIVVPIYVSLLGIEAYGLIGLFTLFQTWMVLFDLGLSPTINREMAMAKAEARTWQNVRDLLRTTETITVSLSIAIAICAVIFAGPLSEAWIQEQSLTSDEVRFSIHAMGIVASLRLIESIYKNVFLGLQENVKLNIMTMAFSTVRAGGAITVLWFVDPSVRTFFLWQGFFAIASLAFLITHAYKILPVAEKAGRFRLSSLLRVWRFAGGMTLFTFLMLCVTQVDKVLLSRLLTLEEFGLYMLATAAAGALLMVVGPIQQVFLPRLSSASEKLNVRHFAIEYDNSLKMLSVFFGSAAMVMSFFSEVFLMLWTQSPMLASTAAPVLTVLSLANMLNGLALPQTIARQAVGWTRLSIYINLGGVLFVVPAVLYLTPVFGPAGAAVAWLCFNLGNILVGLIFTRRKLAERLSSGAEMKYALFPLLAAAVACCAAKAIFPAVPAATLDQLLLLIIAATLTLFSSAMTLTEVRKGVLDFIVSSLSGKR